MTRIIAALTLCLFITPAQAGVPCWVIRQAVAAYGEDTALAWARAHGYSEIKIAAAKRCLKQ